jgi:hypothetical protein
VGAAGLAEAKAAREQVQKVTGSAKPPGARLHVLAIGVSHYGDKASNLKLGFADDDALELASALFSTQDISGAFRGSGGLYAEVKPIPLIDNTATRYEIRRQLKLLQGMMATDDNAIIFFAGHGMMIGNTFYLLPFGADITEVPVSVEETGLKATELHELVEVLTRRGRVLVFLDACHTGAFIAGDTRPNADQLRRAVASGNFGVFTASKGTQTAQEYPHLQHGAFTKLILDAILDTNARADADHNGIITVGELHSYLEKSLPRLTNSKQELGYVTTVGGNLFAIGQ